MADNFANDGATFPIYAAATYPPAFHDPAGGKTWMFWEALDAGDRRVHCTTLDTSSLEFGPVIDVADAPLSNDSHGVPAAAMDHQGYVHCFHGPHDGDMLVTSTAAPRVPSAWVARASISGDYTYPHPIAMDGGLLLFLRKRIATQTRRVLVLRETTSLVDGVPVFGAEQTVVDLGSDSRFYGGVAIQVGSDVHLIAMRSNYAATVRRGVYHFIYDAADGSVRNADGSVVVPAVSLPIDAALANASFRLVDFGSDIGDLPAFCIAAGGDLHVAFARGTPGAFQLFHMMFTSGAWTGPVAIGSIAAADYVTFNDSIALVARPDGSVELWHPDDPTAAWTFGGDMRRMVYAGGSWGASELIRSAAARALGRASPVRDAAAAARVIYCEVAQSDSDSAGGSLRLFAHGDGGHIGRPTPPPSVALQIDSSGNPGAGTDPHFADVALLIDTTES